jgi:Tfp pilus assembly pilus retraction ATPase PilT
VVTTTHAGTVLQAIERILVLAARRDGMPVVRSLMAEGLRAVLHQELIHSSPRRLIARSLFIDTDGIRAKIREGDIAGLDDDMYRQAVEMKKEK